MLQSGVTRHGAVRIEACDLLCSCVREEEEVDRTDDEHGYHDEADVRAEGRLFLAGNSTSVHVTHEIESETNHFRHSFFTNKFLTKTRAPGTAASPMPTKRTAGDEKSSQRACRK